ncbi:hypothetical protein [Ensifer adhaerens]|uniref:hypothetical protein n=1 Tax=Ensifer adhaerens TaxID=106592 RepID=UPI001319F463|nr:hypothetical protein [Ensifer adhaerens]
MAGTFSTADMDAIKQQHEEWCRANETDPNSPAGIEKAMQMLANYGGSASRQPPVQPEAGRAKARA